MVSPTRLRALYVTRIGTSSIWIHPIRPIRCRSFRAASTLTAEWPHISVDNDPDTLSGSDFSNNMLALNLDIDQLIAQVFFAGANPLDSDPSTEDDFEIADLDLVGGLRLLQEFAIGLNSGQTVDLVLEDSTHIPLTIGTGLWIYDASSHDLDHDGTVTFSFDLDPDVQLTNSTSIDVNLSAQVAILRDIPVIDYTVYSDDDIPIADVPIEVYNNTFALNGSAARKSLSSSEGGASTGRRRADCQSGDAPTFF